MSPAIRAGNTKSWDGLMNRSREITVCLSDEHWKKLRDNGRFVIEVGSPQEDVEVHGADLASTGLPIRKLPEPAANNFRACERSCLDCRYVKRQSRGSTITCSKKSFENKCYMLFADRFTCDAFAPRFGPSEKKTKEES